MKIKNYNTTSTQTDKQRFSVHGAFANTSSKPKGFIEGVFEGAIKGGNKAPGPDFSTHTQHNTNEPENNSLSTRTEGSEHDSMFGSLLFECFLGVPLSDAFTQATDTKEILDHIDVGNTLDAYDEFRRDRLETQFKLCQGGQLDSLFGQAVENTLSMAMEACTPEMEEIAAFTMAEGQGSYAVKVGLPVHSY